MLSSSGHLGTGTGGACSFPAPLQAPAVSGSHGAPPAASPARQQPGQQQAGPAAGGAPSLHNLGSIFGSNYSTGGIGGSLEAGGGEGGHHRLLAGGPYAERQPPPPPPPRPARIKAVRLPLNGTLLLQTIR